MARQASDFAVYRGDDFLCLGTADECAEALGVTKVTFYYYASPVYKKRMEKSTNDYIIAIKLDDEED